MNNEESICKPVTTNEALQTSLSRLIKDFNLIWLKIITASQEIAYFRRTTSVPSRLYVAVTQIIVGIPVAVCIIGDVNVVSCTERWTVVVVSVDAAFCNLHENLERVKIIFVFK